MTTLDLNIKKKLLEYQYDHVENLIYILKKNITCLDASSTGVGKSFSAAAVCAQLKLRPIIICPKSILTMWAKVCKIFNVDPIMIVNYETLRSGKYYDKNNKRLKCPYIKIIKTKINNTEVIKYKWTNIDQNTIFIFDEAHKCNDVNTLNGKLLLYTKDTDRHILLLSATIADHAEHFRLFFYILNFIDPLQVKQKDISFERYMYIMNKWVMRDVSPLKRIYEMLYPDRASAMKLSVLGHLIPDTQITATPYNMKKDREQAIQREYKDISEELENLKDKSKTDKANILTKILRAHQKIELLKVPLFVELANDYIENGMSVVIFVNYTQTLEILADMLYTKCLIYGEQTAAQREKNIENFQNNKSKIIICNIKAGSVGISLHDIHGNHPRASLISPTWSSIDLTQALGRIYRSGGKTKTIQSIVYIANTVEEKIAEKLETKLKNINLINNGDLNLSNIVFERERK
jgi:superfamily II DNA or RNA helicase